MSLKALKLSFAIMLGTAFHGYSQLNIQSGATFYMQTGAVVTVEGNVDNAGTLNNDGTLKVKGNYTNTGTYTGVGSAGVLEMNGTGNSNISAGSSVIPNLVVNKTNAADIVKLTASAVVNNTLLLTNGVFTTDPLANPSFTLSAPVAAVFSFAAGKEIIGRVQRTGWTGGVARVFNQPNMLLTTNGGTAPTDVTVIMIPETGGGDPTQAEREVKRKFNFLQTGGSGFTADIRYPYKTSELNNNVEANLVPWTLIATEWNARLTPVARDAVNDYVSTTGISSTAFTQEWKLADPNYTFNATAFIRGPWNSGTLSMNTTINSILPVAQPYNDPAFDNYNGGESVSAGFFTSHTNIVDWVLIDFRKPSSGLPAEATFSNSIGRKAAFLLSNGTIVNLDGVIPVSFDITKQGAGFIVVKHRNHLGIMSYSVPSNALGTFANDFSSLSNIYTNLSIPSDPAQVLPSGGPTKYGMWAGNANKDIVINASDIGLVKANSNVALSGYVFGDVNLDGTVNAGDVGLTKISANGTAQTHTNIVGGKTTVIINKEPIAHIPVN